MSDPIEPVRSALRSLADEGYPVDLGARVLAGMGQRRRRLTLAVSTGLVAVVVMASLIWLGRPRGDEVLTTLTAWPNFPGIGEVAAPDPPSEQLLVAAYSTGAGGQVHVLDPATGAYRLVGVDSVLAVSPDLRFAVVARARTVTEPGGGGPLQDFDIGILSTTDGSVLGRIDTASWVDSSAGVVLSRASWSPDGRRIVLGVRRGVPGQGWLAERLVFVDVSTGAVRAVEIQAGDTLEPLDLLGWTTDSGGVVLAADRIGTDQVASGHLLYDERGVLRAEVEWPYQASATKVIGRDELGLTSVEGDRLSVVNTWTGDVRPHELGGQGLTSARPIAWRGGEVIVREQLCDAGRCADGPTVVAIALDTGDRRPLHVLGESQRIIVVASAGGPVAGASLPAW